MSHFLYAHKDLTKTPNVWKIGVAITPYSAVRARQKFCWEQFGLDYLWFGFPNHIAFLENRIKHDLWNRSGKYLHNIGTQTELFKIQIGALRAMINDLIEEYELCVKEIVLDSPYVASNSGQCPFEIPSEKDAGAWLAKKANTCWPDRKHLLDDPMTNTTKTFNRLFAQC